MEEEADTDEENTIAQISASDPQLLSQTYNKLQENFDDTVEKYLQPNPEMKLQHAEEKALRDLRSDYSRQLIKEYEDLMKLVTVSQKGSNTQTSSCNGKKIFKFTMLLA